MKAQKIEIEIEGEMEMNFSNLINAFCGLALLFGLSMGVYKTYNFVRHEVIMQTQKGLPSLEKFSRQLTAPSKK
ncbi:MAG: hypothetical protein COV44_03080 [Deltaproteobacteria bacterium CG11_big_fil_rev_8_21_14_0_20_45_16]|nr:MAG: hypothetical protein COV44_03080 [Deltaproteobacteria bacterium CG11_big_fil_rev_8_21_14_0_20_45_16]